MPFSVRCRYCRTKLRVPRRMAGHSFCCVMCGKVNFVPKRAETSDAHGASRRGSLEGRPLTLVARIKVRCPTCETRIKVTVEAPTT